MKGWLLRTIEIFLPVVCVHADHSCSGREFRFWQPTFVTFLNSLQGEIYDRRNDEPRAANGMQKNGSMKKPESASGKKAKEARCPYCVLGLGFREMKVLANGRQICEHCGHIAFPNDTTFKCPCQKCLEVDFSPKIRRLRRR